MFSKKRKSRSSRKRPSVVGLLFVLTTAVLLGVGVGSYMGSKLGTSPAQRPTTRLSAVQPKSTSNPQKKEQRVIQTADEHVKPRTSTPQKIEHEAPPQNKSEPDKSKPAKISRSVAPPVAQVREEPRPAQSLPRRRPIAMPGEIAHAAVSNKIALTFDAGASGVPTPAVLNALRASGLRVTFFITGKWAEQNPQLVKQIRQDGHEIGNHTYSHPDLRKLSDAEIREQLEKTDEVVTRITGRPCDPYFRPPYGARNKRVIRIAAEMGYTTIYWSLDSWDAFKKNITSSEVKERVLERVQGGDIVLMHCGSQATADALPSIIQELQSRGYQVVSVSELIGR